MVKMYYISSVLLVFHYCVRLVAILIYYLLHYSLLVCSVNGQELQIEYIFNIEWNLNIEGKYLVSL